MNRMSSVILGNIVVHVNIATDLNLSSLSSSFLSKALRQAVYFTQNQIWQVYRDKILSFGPQKAQDFDLITQTGQLNLSISLKSLVCCPQYIISSTSLVKHNTSNMGHTILYYKNYNLLKN